MTDKPYNPIPHKQIYPSLQFLILIGLLIGLLIIGSFIGVGIIVSRYGLDTLTDIVNSNFSSPHATTALWILQITGTTFPILITPIFFSYVIVREPDNYLKTNFNFPWLLLILVFFTMILSAPLIEWLSNINQQMVLPKFLKGVQDWMRQSEDQAKVFSDNMMQMPTIWNMVFDLLFIGLLTAVVEEILFRGCMQTVFIRWTKNKHVAIWITAILFSAFHMEFFGFLPRLLLGLLFGYFTAWSGSIWPAIWGHFVNNGTAVIMVYLHQNNMINFNPDEAKTFNTAGYIISLIITLFLLFIYRYISNRRQIADINGEELD